MTFALRDIGSSGRESHAQRESSTVGGARDRRRHGGRRSGRKQDRQRCAACGHTLRTSLLSDRCRSCGAIDGMLLLDVNVSANVNANESSAASKAGAASSMMSSMSTKYDERDLHVFNPNTWGVTAAQLAALQQGDEEAEGANPSRTRSRSNSNSNSEAGGALLGSSAGRLRARSADVFILLLRLLLHSLLLINILLSYYFHIIQDFIE